MDAIARMLQSAPEQALEKMLAAYTGLVYHAAAAVLGRDAREEIEECASDAFFSVYARRGELDFDKGSVKAYLCASARNMAVDRLKKRRRAEAVALDERMPAPEQTDNMALARMESDALIQSVRALGEPDSTILICRYYFGMRTREIARMTGMKENTIDQRLRRALIKLKNSDQGGYHHAE